MITTDEIPYSDDEGELIGDYNRYRKSNLQRGGAETVRAIDMITTDEIPYSDDELGANSEPRSSSSSEVLELS
jgi:hypothetical protein